MRESTTTTKNERKILQSGVRALVMYSGVASYVHLNSLVRSCLAESNTALRLKDVRPVDKQDDGAAYRIFEWVDAILRLSWLFKDNMYLFVLGQLFDAT